MIVQRVAQNGDLQEIHPLDTPLEENQFTPKFTPVADYGSLLLADYDKYGAMRKADGKPAIYIPNFREVLLAFQGINPQVNLSNLELVVATSFHVQALRSGCVADITPLTIAGITQTRDNRIMYGVRGGSTGVGQANIVPGGHATPHINYSPNPVFSSWKEEIAEELGISTKADCRLIGYQTDPQHKSLCFVTQSRTFLSSGELEEMHDEAFEIYNSAKAAGIPELDARKKIAAAGLGNVDAWENTSLIALPDDPRYLAKIIATGTTRHNGQDFRTFDNSIGALIMHILTPQ